MSGPGFTLIDEREMEYVQQALKSGTLMRYRHDSDVPSFVYRLERYVEQQFETPHCLALNSGTSALVAGLRAAGIGPGDEVIVPGYTFIASVAAVVQCGSTPVLAEIDESLTMCPGDVANRITDRTRALMPVHMLGAPADMDALRRLAKAHNLLLIEDVAQACGGSYRGRRLGTIGDVGAFSLNHYKVVTAGEGGLCITADRNIYERAYAYHDHGFRPLRQGTVENDGMFGLNLRMPDLTGAVALAQMEKLERILACTRSTRNALAQAIGGVPGAVRRRENDPPGDCATTLTYTFDTAERAAATATALGTRTLLHSGKHYYGNMRQLAMLPEGRQSISAGTAEMPQRRSYAPGSLPRTDDLLARSVALATGMSDWYAGTAVGVPLNAADEVIAAAAEKFQAAVRDGHAHKLTS